MPYDEHTKRCLKKSIREDRERWHKCNLELARQYSQGTFRWMAKTPEDNEAFLDSMRLKAVHDKIGPALRRYEDGITGKTPRITVGESRHADALSELDAGQYSAESAQQSSEGDDIFLTMQDVLREWIDDLEIHAVMQQFVLEYAACGEATLRIYIPDEYADDINNGMTLQDLDAAMEYPHAHMVKAGDAGKILDDDGRTIGLYYRYKRKQSTRYEVHLPDEVVHLDSGYNVLQDSEGVELRMDNYLADSKKRRGRYLLYHLQRANGPMVNETIITMQDSLNRAIIYLNRILEEAGSRMIITANADDVYDENDKVVKWHVKPATVIKLRSVQLIEDDDESFTSGNPDVIVVDPVDANKYFLPVIAYFSNQINTAFQEGYLETANMQAISGESKRMSEAPFMRMIEREAEPIAKAYEWLCKAVLRTAFFAIDKNPPPQFDVIVDLELTIPSGSVDAFENLRAAYRENTASLEAVIEHNPYVPDKAKEMRRVLAGTARQAGIDVAITEQNLADARARGLLADVDEGG